MAVFYRWEATLSAFGAAYVAWQVLLGALYVLHLLLFPSARALLVAVVSCGSPVLSLWLALRLRRVSLSRLMALGVFGLSVAYPLLLLGVPAERVATTLGGSLMVSVWGALAFAGLTCLALAARGTAMLPRGKSSLIIVAGGIAGLVVLSLVRSVLPHFTAQGYDVLTLVFAPLFAFYSAIGGLLGGAPVVSKASQPEDGQSVTIA